MITETTAMSCAAFGALSTGLGITAGLGWIRCARMLAKAHKALKIARDIAAHWQADSQNHKADAWLHKCNAEIARDRAIDAEDRLRKIEQSRHASAKHARAAQIAQRKAAIAATTTKLRDELQAAQPAERLAA